MENQKIKILAVSPGTKYLGIAILKVAELVHWGIKSLKSKGMSRSWVTRKAERIVGRLIEEHGPAVVVIREAAYPQSKSSVLLKAVIERIKRLAKRKRLRVYALSPLLAKEYICRNGKANKMEMEKVIVTEYYPWLFRRYEKDLEKVRRGHWWKRKYYFPLFDAVALGLYCYQRIKQRKLPSSECPSPPVEGSR